MAACFEVKDPVLNQALLTHYLQQIESGPGCMDRLLVSGASGDLIDHLRSRATVSELCRVASFSRPVFTVSFDDKALMARFEQNARIMHDEQIKEYLARNGASTQMLSSWFSLSRSEADALRTAVAPARTAGRPRLPDVDVRDEIHAAWAQIPSRRPEREAYYELHQQFKDITVTALYQVIHEHDITPGMIRRESGRFTGTYARANEDAKARA